MSDIEELRFPIGRFRFPDSPVPAEARAEMLDAIDGTPAALRRATAGLDDEQLDTRYRPDGWTLRQVVHHVADSHVNSYCRFKLAMTEEHPTIRAYEEANWAELSDGRDGDIELSLQLLERLHTRWVGWLRTLSDDDWARTLHHPEAGDLVLDQLLALYAWHGPHHVAHVTGLRERNGW
ncbi:MAG: putative metal-dependent hydrolase [Gemmatimonadota bacterium]|nr:putative metal-dependent hydrolase [Gemmatimonadota bacterium]